MKNRLFPFYPLKILKSIIFAHFSLFTKGIFLKCNHSFLLTLPFELYKMFKVSKLKAQGSFKFKVGYKTQISG